MIALLSLALPVSAMADLSAPDVQSTTVAVGETTASVQSYVSPGGQVTTVSVDYDLASSPWCASGGASGSPAYQAGGAAMGETDSAYHLYAVNLANLTASTPYCAEMVAQNNSGTAHSASPVSFTTSSPTPGAGGTGYNDNAGAPISFSVTVTLAGPGSGTVTGGGISCPSTCSGNYPSGSAVTLNAVPASGSRFTGWSGACSGVGPCNLVASSNLAATATFATSSSSHPAPRCTLAANGSSVLRAKSSHPDAGKTKNLPGTVAFTARCDQSARATLTGTLTATRVAHRSKQSRTFKLAPVHASLSAHQAQVVHVQVPALALAALQGNARESVVVTLTASNANGKASVRAVIARIRGAS